MCMDLETHNSEINVHEFIRNLKHASDEKHEIYVEESLLFF